MKVESFQVMNHDRVTVMKPNTHLASKMLQVIKNEPCADLLSFFSLGHSCASLPDWVLSDVEATLSALAQEWRDDSQSITLIMWDNCHNEWNGLIRLTQQSDAETVKIDCWIRPRYAGSGNARLALNLIQRELQQQYPQLTLTICCKETDVMQRGLALICGFHYHSTVKQAVILPSGLIDNLVIYAQKALNESDPICQTA